MRVRDDVRWQEQLSEFEADDLSRRFRDFLVFWMDTTDKLVSEELSLTGAAAPSQLAATVSKALEIAEQTMGFLSIEWIAQMLLVMTQHWTHGEALYEGLSFIERRLVEQATAMKLAELQEGAILPIEK